MTAAALAALPMDLRLRPFETRDYDAAHSLWRATPGVGLSDDDAELPLLRFLARNEGLSHVAVDAGAIVGTILCGHDGRRGLIHHLVVAPSHRRLGIARRLLSAGLAGLRLHGIRKAHLLVFRSNAEGLAFWRAAEHAMERTEIALFSVGTASHAL